jgi:hypothetical protein
MISREEGWLCRAADSSILWSFRPEWVVPGYATEKVQRPAGKRPRIRNRLKLAFEKPRRLCESELGLGRKIPAG